MVHIRIHLPTSLPFWLLWLTMTVFSSLFVSSSSTFDNRAKTIVKSIDDYLCQNYVFTCFFRQRYHQSFDQQRSNQCKSLLILHSCLHYDTASINVCHSTTLNRAKENLRNQTPMYCFTSSVYKNFNTQHLRSIASARRSINWQIFVFFPLLILFAVCTGLCY